MARSIGQIDAITMRGQAADDQVRWLVWAGVGGFLVGIIFWAIFPGMIARALPQDSHVPEWMAAKTMGMDQRAAGVRMVATAGPANIVSSNPQAGDHGPKRTIRSRP